MTLAWERRARGRARASDRRGGQKYRRCERTSSSGVHGPFVLFSSASRGLAAAAVDDGGEPPSRGDARVGARGGAGVGTSISCRVLSSAVCGRENPRGKKRCLSRERCKYAVSNCRVYKTIRGFHPSQTPSNMGETISLDDYTVTTLPGKSRPELP